MSAYYDRVVGRIRIGRTQQRYGFGLCVHCDYCAELLHLERIEVRAGATDYPLVAVTVASSHLSSLLRHVVDVQLSGSMGVPPRMLHYTGYSSLSHRACSEYQTPPADPPTFIAHVDLITIVPDSR